MIIFNPFSLHSAEAPSSQFRLRAKAFPISSDTINIFSSNKVYQRFPISHHIDKPETHKKLSQASDDDEKKKRQREKKVNKLFLYLYVPPSVIINYVIFYQYVTFFITFNPPTANLSQTSINIRSRLRRIHKFPIWSFHLQNMKASSHPLNDILRSSAKFWAFLWFEGLKQRISMSDGCHQFFSLLFLWMNKKWHRFTRLWFEQHHHMWIFFINDNITTFHVASFRFAMKIAR